MKKNNVTLRLTEKLSAMKKESELSKTSELLSKKRKTKLEKRSVFFHQAAKICIPSYAPEFDIPMFER